MLRERLDLLAEKTRVEDQKMAGPLQKENKNSYVAWRGDKRIGSRMSRDGIERRIDRILKREARADVDRDVDKYVQHN